MSFAFFDLDHTLLPFDTQALFCDFVLRRERWRMIGHLAFAPVAVLRGCSLVRTVTAKRAFLGHLAGMKRDTLIAYSREFAEQTVKPWVYPELLTIIEEHRKAGRVLVLNTASPDFYAHDIARVLGFDHCIATCVEVPGANGQGETREEALENVRDAIEGYIAALEQDNLPVPEETREVVTLNV